MHKMLLQIWSLLMSLGAFVLGNVEKTIFVAPDAVQIPPDMSIENLYQIPLNPKQWAVRTKLISTFPSKEKPKGTESWFLLQGLRPRQRYEIRVCWLATQPTNFSVYTHKIADAFDDPALLTSMSTYAHKRRNELPRHDLQRLQARAIPVADRSTEESLLFLQIFAAADYFSTNRTLMEQVPPVHVDIILDPFIWNVFPRSLMPTAGYISGIAILAWFVSTWLLRLLNKIVESPHEASARQSATRSMKKSQ